MTEDKPGGIGWGRVIVGLLGAALTGWMLLTAKDFLPTYIEEWQNPSADPYYRSRLNSLLAFYVVFGIPIALGVCAFVGIPAWAIADNMGRRRAVDAALVGGIAGLVIALPIALYTLLVLAGPTITLRENGTTFVENGSMTVHAWARIGVDFLYMIGVGSVSGLVAWIASGAARLQR
jgi:hypothetical protein